MASSNKLIDKLDTFSNNHYFSKFHRINCISKLPGYVIATTVQYGNHGYESFCISLCQNRQKKNNTHTHNRSAAGKITKQTIRTCKHFKRKQML